MPGCRQSRSMQSSQSMLLLAIVHLNRRINPKSGYGTPRACPEQGPQAALGSGRLRGGRRAGEVSAVGIVPGRRGGRLCGARFVWTVSHVPVLRRHL
uniref:Uncharacterized protein n=1 Tax=Arundo donax TaxID=35708 RepID=A0A0A9DXM5_ARUDO